MMSKIGGTIGRIAPALLACALVMACMHGGDAGDEGDTRTWKGFIQNTCGSADGPAISIRVGRSADTTCDADFSSDSSHRMFFDGYQVDSLRVGTVLTDSFFPCADDCFSRIFLKLEIKGVTSGALSGSMEIKEGGGATPVEIRKFPVILKKCPETIEFCG